LNKGESKFLMKQIYLIIAILSITIVINQIISLTGRSAKDNKLIDFRSQTNDILNTMITSTECLAMEYNGQLIIDEYTLKEFDEVFPDVEPNCIKNYDYGYSVKVEKFNNTIQRAKYWEPDIPIGNRELVLILDNSVSMNEKMVSTDPSPKLYYAKRAVKDFVKCANETDRLAFFTFDGACGVKNFLESNGFPEFTQLDSEETKNDISRLIEDKIEASAGTPLINAIESSAETMKNAISSKDRVIILFTDGRESCCQQCESGEKPGSCGGGSCNYGFNDIKGTCCCLDVCSDALCNYNSDNMNYLIKNNIPIYTIFLGDDKQGQSQMECISQKTGGESFLVDDPDILPSLFCEIAGEREPEVEDYEVWEFGAKDYSKGDLLRSSYTVTSPVNIRINDMVVQPGLITITVFDGQLEELTGMIRNVCENGGKIQKRIYLSSPAYLENGKICMLEDGESVCKKVLCNYDFDGESYKTLDIEFDGVDSAGSYLFTVMRNKDSVEVIV
jgi:hypothetical protein